MGHTFHRTSPVRHRAAHLSQISEAPREQGWSRQILVELNRYGITVFDDVYEWGGSRYGNAPDAIAAAKRGSKPGRADQG